ncbi:type 4a pilus biogenesis protein PilO, partial [Paraglaciecola sp.]
MKFDFNKLKEINDLDFEQVAVWPFEVKTVVVLFVIILSLVGGYYGLVKSKLPLLESAQNKEADLKLTFQAKYRIAVNLKAYEEQLTNLQNDFSSMLKSL